MKQRCIGKIELPRRGGYNGRRRTLNGTEWSYGLFRKNGEMACFFPIGNRS